MSLLDEINARPELADLVATKEHGQIAAALSVGRTKVEKVAIADIQAYLQTNGVWWDIKTTSLDAGSPAQAAAVALLDVANARYNNIDTTLPVVGQMLSGLVNAGVLTQTNMDEIVALGVVPAPVTNQQVIEALGV